MKRAAEDKGEIPQKIAKTSEEISQRKRHVPKSFEVFPVNSRFSGKFPFYRQPKEIGCFSLDNSRIFLDDNSRLRYYYPPSNCNDVCFDLRKGYDIFIRRDETKREHIDNLLQWVQLHKDRFVPAGEKISDSLYTDFICWRGLLTKLLCTPYENREDWKIGVTKFKGTWYLCEFETETKKTQLKEQSEKLCEMTYWGWKFEQYVTSDSEHSQPNTSVPVNNIEAYCSVVRGRLNQNSLVFGAEVDCRYKRSGKLIELKTSREIYQQHQDRNFKKFKLIKWWAQSFLPGISQIICGFRDDDGVVQRLQTFETLKIPELIKDMPNCWEPSVCFNFCDKFLSFVKEVVVKDDPRIVYLFDWAPRSPVQWTELAPNSDFVFLPNWFTEK